MRNHVREAHAAHQSEKAAWQRERADCAAKMDTLREKLRKAVVGECPSGGGEKRAKVGILLLSRCFRRGLKASADRSMAGPGRQRSTG